MIPEETLSRIERAETSMHCSVMELRELVQVYRASQWREVSVQIENYRLVAMAETRYRRIVERALRIAVDHDESREDDLLQQAAKELDK